MDTVYKFCGYIVALLVIVGIAFGTGWHYGSDHTQEQWDLVTQAQTKADLQDANKASLIGMQTVTVFVDRIHVIMAQGATITKEVTKYVTAKDDASCTINNGFVSVFNAAAAGSNLSDAPGPSDAAGSGVSLSAVATVTAANFVVCRATAEQLTQLQAWVRAEAALYGAPGPSGAEVIAK